MPSTVQLVIIIIVNHWPVPYTGNVILKSNRNVYLCTRVDKQFPLKSYFKKSKRMPWEGL